MRTRALPWSGTAPAGTLAISSRGPLPWLRKSATSAVAGDTDPRLRSATSTATSSPALGSAGAWTFRSEEDTLRSGATLVTPPMAATDLRASSSDFATVHIGVAVRRNLKRKSLFTT